MTWLKILAFAFNFLGVLFLVAAGVIFFMAVAVGGSAGAGMNDAATFGAFVGGMMGTVAAVSNFLAALAMFFGGAVLWVCRRLLEEVETLASQRVVLTRD